MEYFRKWTIWMDRIDYGRLIRVNQIVFQWQQHCPRNIQQITIHMEITHITTIIISSTINTMSQRLQMVSYRLVYCFSFCFFFLKYFLNVCNLTVNIVSVLEPMWFLTIFNNVIPYALHMVFWHKKITTQLNSNLISNSMSIFNETCESLATLNHLHSIGNNMKSALIISIHLWHLMMPFLFFLHILLHGSLTTFISIPNNTHIHKWHGFVFKILRQNSENIKFKWRM